MDIAIGDKTGEQEVPGEVQGENQDAKIRQDRVDRVNKAKDEIEAICKKYNVSICVNPTVLIVPEPGDKRPKDKQDIALRKTIRKLADITTKYKTFLRVNPVVEIRPRDVQQIRKIIPGEGN